MTPDIKVDENLPVVFDYTKDQCFFIFKKTSGSAIQTVPKNFHLTSAKFTRRWWWSGGSTELRFTDERSYPSTISRTFSNVTLAEHNAFCEQLHQHYYDTAFVNKL